MNEALVELLATPKVSSNAKLIALYVARVSTPDTLQMLKNRDVADATGIDRTSAEKAWRELMKLGWIKSPKPDHVLMAGDALARRALARDGLEAAAVDLAPPPPPPPKPQPPAPAPPAPVVQPKKLGNRLPDVRVPRSQRTPKPPPAAPSPPAPEEDQP